MSEQTTPSPGASTKGGELKQTERIVQGPGPGRGPFGGGMVGQKAMDFWPSAKRLVRRMAPAKVKASAVVVLAVVSVSLMAFGPKVLGYATDLIFSGLVGSMLARNGFAEGTPKSQVVAALRGRGQDNYADMVSSMDVVVGRGVDFGAVAVVLGWVLAIYVVASLLGWLQGYLLNDVVQRTVYDMREEVEEKVHRLPLQLLRQAATRRAAQRGSPTTSTTSARRCSRR